MLRPLNVLRGVLRGVGIITLADLVGRTEAELLVIKNVRRKDGRLLQERLGAPGLQPRHDACPKAAVGSFARENAAGERILEAE